MFKNILKMDLQARGNQNQKCLSKGWRAKNKLLYYIVMEQQSVFTDLNLSDARLDNESREDYKSRLKFNRKVLKLYNKIGREAYKAAFPQGIVKAYAEAEANAKDELSKLKKSENGKSGPKKT